MRWLLALLIALGCADAGQAESVLEVNDAQRIEAVLTYTPTYPRLEAAEWISVVPRAPNLPGQVDVSTHMEPAAEELEELSALRRPVLFARTPVRTKEMARSVRLEVVYQATLRSRHLRALAAGETAQAVAPLSDPERKAWLADIGDADHQSGAVQTWIQREGLRRGRGESDLDFARRVFRHLRATFEYDYQRGADHHASTVCAARKSDCGGLSALFVAVLRSEGIPARALFGRWAVSAKKGEEIGGVPYFQWHVKSEFFAAGVGWVPVDVSSGILHDRTESGLAYFGHDAGDFLAMHVDAAIEVDTIHFGRRNVHNLQVPAVWVTGRGSANDARFAERWQVKRIERGGIE